MQQIQWYSWLNFSYRQIIKQYYMKRSYPVILFHAPPGLGIKNLIWNISSWLMCFFSTGLKSCGICQSCNLMKMNNHPDLVTINSCSSIGIDIIRLIYNKIYQRSQLGKSKIIWIAEANKLTEEASNALLKTLEEPPDNTYFFLYSYNLSGISAILRSRCQDWQISPPRESEGIQWIKINFHNRSCLTDNNIIAALRICSWAPLAAIKLLQSNYWTYRAKIAVWIIDILNDQKDILEILPFFNHDNVQNQIEVFCTLFIDAIKLQYDKNVFIINYDVPNLLHQLSKLSGKILHESLKSWLILQHYFTHVKSANRKLLLIDQLLNWQQLIKSSNKRKKICF
ncbi:MAG: DNA polymerase III subunit delta' C-terminal domain-containing protein [Candidatus Dasytiphilus stammeri]